MTNTTEKALLVGNGINRVFCDSDYSWGNLLQDLSKLGSGSIDLSNPFKPFPLAFEEILTTKGNSYNRAVRVLKTKTAEIFGKIPVKETHRMIANNTKYRNVLTTNYEYTLEKAYAEKINHQSDFREACKNTRSTNEEIHSLFRKYEFKDELFSVWHIHGEINDTKYSKAKVIIPSNSVLIGYSQYVSYLDAIYQYLFTDRITKSTRISSLHKKMSAYRTGPDSVNMDTWVDYFFFKDIDIIGLTLDFSEMHIWWILNRRFSLKKDSDIFSKKQDEKASFSPINTITYYYPMLSTKSREDKCSIPLTPDKQQAIVNMLDVLGVITKKVRCKSYEDFYTQVLSTPKVD